MEKHYDGPDAVMPVSITSENWEPATGNRVLHRHGRAVHNFLDHLLGLF
jgi:hypothetical protein